MTKKHILGTGLSGLVGSKLVEMFSQQYEFQNLDLSMGVDITDEKLVHDAVEKSPAETIIHFAAFTDVTRAHQEQGDRTGVTYKVNVIGTKNIAQAAKKFGKHLIHISTAYVFDGEKEGLYVESDPMHPIEWYGQTKAWAEEEVVNSGVEYTILRIDQPYRQDDFPKPDILHRIKKGLEEGTLPPMFTDHTFTATSIETFSEWIQQIIEKKITGLYHATTDAMTTDYQFAQKVKEQFGLSAEIREGSLIEFLKTANRPYQKNTAMDNAKLKKVLGIS